MKLLKTITRDNIYYEHELKDYEVFKHQLIAKNIQEKGEKIIKWFTNFKEEFAYHYINCNLIEVQVYQQ